MTISVLYQESFPNVTGMSRSLPIPIVTSDHVEIAFLYYVSVRGVDGMHYAAPTDMHKFTLHGTLVSAEPFADPSLPDVGVLGVHRLPDGCSPDDYTAMRDAAFADMDALLLQYARGEPADPAKALRVLSFYARMAEARFWPATYERVGATFFAWLRAAG